MSPGNTAADRPAMVTRPHHMTIATPKQIVILAYGSRGDIQPMAALGNGLQAAGFSVRLAAPSVFETFVEAQGLEFAPLAGDPAILSQALVESGKGSWLGVVREMMAYVLPLAQQVYHQVQVTCQGADAILHSFLMTNAGHEMARQLNIPDFSLQLFPVFARTASFPSILFPDLPLGKYYRLWSHDLNTRAFWWSSRMGYNWLRRKAPHLPPLSGWPFDARDRLPPPLLFGFSPHVIPPPPEWEGRAYVTGYWFLDDEPGWEPPANLLQFLDAGPPPVYIGFGSVVTEEAERLTKLVLAALGQANQRAVLSMGWGGLAPANLPPEVFALEKAPHSWLFPRMAAVVHHGGAGTTGAGLRAGVPSILIPFTTDQPFWSKIVQKLGVGPSGIPVSKLNATNLGAAIQTAVTDASMRQRASALGRAIRNEDGIGTAVEIIQARLEGAG